MQIRPGAPGGDDDDDEPGGGVPDSEPDASGESDAPPPLTEMRWHVDRAMLIAKVVGVVVFAAIPQVFSLNLAARWFGIVVAVGLAGLALRDIIAPVRLAADAESVRMISGFSGHRTIGWDDIERMRVIRQRGSAYLEIETPETVHLFSRYDLSTSPSDALEALRRVVH